MNAITEERTHSAPFDMVPEGHVTVNPEQCAPFGHLRQSAITRNRQMKPDLISSSQYGEGIQLIPRISVRMTNDRRQLLNVNTIS